MIRRIRLPAARLCRAASGFCRGERGVAAVEFALVLPLMVLMLLGLSEVTLAVNNDRKVTLVSRALADLSSRVGTLGTADVNDIFKASALIMQPFDASKLKMVLSQMKVTKVGSTYQGTVDWSCASGNGATPKPKVGIYPVPTGFQNDGGYYILVEATLPYTPIFGRTITGTINLGEPTPWPIRNTTKVTLSGNCPT